MKCWQCGKDVPMIDSYTNHYGYHFEDYECEACDAMFSYDFGEELWNAFVYQPASSEDCNHWREVAGNMPHLDTDAIERRWRERLEEEQ